MVTDGQASGGTFSTRVSRWPTRPGGQGCPTRRSVATATKPRCPAPAPNCPAPTAHGPNRSPPDAIIYGTPTYMGGYSAQMKAFIDACAGIWFKQSWKDKLAAGFTHSQGRSGDKLNTLQGLMVNAMQHNMVWVGTGILVEGPDKLNRPSSYAGAMAQSFPPDAAVSEGDKKTCAALGTRVAEAAARWAKGK